MICIAFIELISIWSTSRNKSLLHVNHSAEFAGFIKKAAHLTERKHIMQHATYHMCN
jgi:hypothetical protein